MSVPQNIMDHIEIKTISTPSYDFQTEVQQLLDQAWDSPRFQDILETLDTDNRTLEIFFQQGEDGAAGNGNGVVYIDLNAEVYVDSTKKRYFFNKLGELQEMTPLRALVHEITHAVLGLHDGTTGHPSDGLTTNTLANSTVESLQGEAVSKTNSILNDIEQYGERVSYKGVIHEFDVEGDLPKTSWTEGNVIDTALVDHSDLPSNYLWDLESLNDSRDLFIGLSDKDWIFGGGGNDYLYGGEGDDRLHGGAGNDILHGGTLNNFSGQGFDTADYFHAENVSVISWLLGMGRNPGNLTVVLHAYPVSSGTLDRFGPGR